LAEGKADDERLTELAEKEVTPALLALGSEEAESDPEIGGRSGGRRNGGSERRVSN